MSDVLPQLEPMSLDETIAVLADETARERLNLGPQLLGSLVLNQVSVYLDELEELRREAVGADTVIRDAKQIASDSEAWSPEETSTKARAFEAIFSQPILAKRYEEMLKGKTIISGGYHTGIMASIESLNDQPIRRLNRITTRQRATGRFQRSGELMSVVATPFGGRVAVSAGSMKVSEYYMEPLIDNITREKKASLSITLPEDDD